MDFAGTMYKCLLLYWYKSTNADTSSLCVGFAVLAKEQSEEEEEDAV